MAIRAPFQPQAGAGQTLAPAAASASVTIGPTKQVAFTNTGAAICYVRFGVGATTASTADYPILPNSQVVLSKDEQQTTLAFISATGTSLHVIPGEGW